MTLISLGLFFVTFVLFSSVIYIMGNQSLLDIEANKVQQTTLNIQKRFKELDNISTDQIVTHLYSPENIVVEKIDNILIETDNHEMRSYLSGELYTEQYLYVFDYQKQLVYMSDYTEQYPSVTDLNEIVRGTLGDKIGYFYTLPINNQSGNLIGYVQVFQDLTSYETISSNILTIFSGLMMVTALAYTLILVRSIKSILNPLSHLNRTINYISEHPDDMSRRTQVTSQDEIGQLADNFNSMLEKVEKYSALQSQFVSDVSHELRTPVAVIQGHLSMLQRWGKDDPEILDESLQAALDESNRMGLMISEMLDLVRIQGSFEQFQDEQTELASSIEKVLGNFNVLHPEFSFNMISGDEFHFGQIYQAHFEQALTILLDNACKYSPDIKQVTVSIAQDGGSHVVSVRDKGEGISQDDLEHIFERFYRTDKSRNRTSTKSGLGIGLSILNQIIKAYNCSLTVDSQLGEGTEFVIRIPFADKKK